MHNTQDAFIPDDPIRPRLPARLAGRPSNRPLRDLCETLLTLRLNRLCVLCGYIFDCSTAYAICRTPRSSPCRPTICNPTGNPSGVVPAGTDTAGQRVVLIQ